VGEEELAALAAFGAASAKETRHGIPAEVVIPQRKRTALHYLYEPLDRALWRSFRED
jgi:HlyD family secretion protein